MNKTTIGHSVKAALAGIAFFALPLATQAQTQPLTLCMEDIDVYPWVTKDGRGLNVVLLELLSAKYGLQVKLAAVPWKRCLGEIEAGTIAGGFSASYKDERAKYAVYPMANGKLDASRRMMNDGYTLYRATGSTIGWDGSKFLNLTGPVGANAGYSIVDDLKKWGATVDDGAKSSDNSMKKLIAGAVQGAAFQTLEGEMVAAKPEYVGKVEKVSPPLVEKPLFLIFGKNYYSKNQKFVEDFWNMVAAVRESAEYKAKESAFLKK